jgi:hypothetical protein
MDSIEFINKNKTYINVYKIANNKYSLSNLDLQKLIKTRESKNYLLNYKI